MAHSYRIQSEIDRIKMLKKKLTVYIQERQYMPHRIVAEIKGSTEEIECFVNELNKILVNAAITGNYEIVKTITKGYL